VTQTQNALDVHVTGRRVVATLVDAIIFAIIGGVFTALFGTTSESSGFKLTTLSTGGSVLLFVIALLYYVLLEGLLGRTLGKMVTGIRVVRESTGATPGVGPALVRTLLRIIDGLLGNLVGFLIVVSTQKRQRLGDMAAKTLVVRG
jgi:uncharacterized RDD family membrane protein YckC